MKYSCINIQGNLITEEILEKIEDGSANGQSNSFFGLEDSTNLRNEIEYAWSRIRLDWNHFNEKSQNLPAGDPYGTTLTRRWMENFLSTLGFSLIRQRASVIGDNQQSYFISHTAQNLDGLPVHIVGFTDPERPEKNTLDIRSSGGSSRLTPHSTIQEYLNVTEHLYGIAANGWNLRLMRDSGRLVKLTYLEFDLRRMLDEDKYSEFTLLYRLMHCTRFPRSMQETGQSLLEKYYQESIETGNRIREGLSKAVQRSLVALGNGFLQSKENNELREKIRRGELSTIDFYRQLRRLVYRLLFLMVMEERNLVYDPENRDEALIKKKSIYLNHYSIARLRKLSEKRYLHELKFSDLWQGLLHTFRLFEGVGPGKKLGIAPLSGDLFSSEAIKDLESFMLSNKLLLECIRQLNEFEDEGHTLVQVNYRALDVEELGSVYEGLLELHPIIEHIDSDHPATIQFLFHEGKERKTTGSYYTRPDLVNELIKSALIPVIEERLTPLKSLPGATPPKSSPKGEDLKEFQEKALLSLKVCDPAAGSGHFLLAAARTIAWYLARIRSGEENPPPSEYRSSLRDVIQHCIYGVDLNPDAVELCKLALWLESHNSGKPLSFLDHKIRCGNSLVGVTDLKVLTEPLPDEAFNPVTGDDKEVCKELKRLNKAYRKTRQTDLFSALEQQISHDRDEVIENYKAIDQIGQDTLEAIDEIRKRYGKARTGLYQEESACNIWTSAFFKTYTSADDPTNPTSEKLAQFFLAPSQYGMLVGKATALASQYRFFHWPLEFPDVFQQGGFDVMLGNPPWERIKFEEKEFFINRMPEISNAKTKAKRTKLISALKTSDPLVYQEYQNGLHNAECFGKFIRHSNRFNLTANGDLNTYSIFTEHSTKTINKSGRMAIIVPLGIATDDSTKDFFVNIIQNQKLISLYGFTNWEFIFKDVGDRFAFCLLTISGDLHRFIQPFLAFHVHNVLQLQQPDRRFTLTREDFNLINPNTNSCPIFRTVYDANLTKKLYSNSTIIHNDKSGANQWSITLFRMFDMSLDSHLFHDMPIIGDVPLYEAKMFFNYDHRYGNYNDEMIFSGQVNFKIIPTPSIEDLQNPDFFVKSRFTVTKSEVAEKLKTINWPYKWFISYRLITLSVNERTTIASILPFCAVGNSGPLIFFENQPLLQVICSFGMFNSLVFDYIARQKVGGTNFSFFVFYQLPILPKHKITNDIVAIIIPKVIELAYSSWDIKSFADDIWQESDDILKTAIRRQWQLNQENTSGHTWTPPDWAEQPADPNKPGYTGCPLPPFKWDEERRAVLKAELDAIYAKLYGLTTDELRYILDPQDVYGPDFPGETFRVLKEKEIRLYGEYRTKRLVMEAWGRINKNDK